jgi:hypothetical protein
MDRLTLLVAVGTLGVCALASVLGMVALELAGRAIPPALAAVSGTALGAIGGLLSQPRDRA